MFQGKTVRDGIVELFDLENHPRAFRAYGGYPLAAKSSRPNNHSGFGAQSTPTFMREVFTF
jgi:hypothetical protein